MKRLIASFAVVMGMWSAGSSRAWAGDGQECSNATLQGSYGFEQQGFSPAVGHTGGVGVTTFDGNGNISGAQTFVSEASGVHRNTFTGTYEVHPDCTGSVESGPLIFDIVIASSGNEMLMIATNEDSPGAQRVITYVFKKVFPD